MFLLDTNIAILARDGEDAILDAMATRSGALFMSALSLAELQRGFHRDPAAATVRRIRLDALLRAVPVVPFDAEAAFAYGAIIADCGWDRARDYDRMIAGHAMSMGAILVTNNIADFGDIRGLRIENWVSDKR